MKYPIKKNTVQETLVIPMYGRKMCSQLYPKIYRDETALRLIDQVDYDFSALEEKAKSIMHRFGFLGGRHAAERPRVGGSRLSQNASECGGGQPRLRAGDTAAPRQRHV